MTVLLLTFVIVMGSAVVLAAVMRVIAGPDWDLDPDAGPWTPGDER